MLKFEAIGLLEAFPSSRKLETAKVEAEIIINGEHFELKLLKDCSPSPEKEIGMVTVEKTLSHQAYCRE